MEQRSLGVIVAGSLEGKETYGTTRIRDTASNGGHNERIGRHHGPRHQHQHPQHVADDARNTQVTEDGMSLCCSIKCDRLVDTLHEHDSTVVKVIVVAPFAAGPAISLNIGVASMVLAASWVYYTMIFKINEQPDDHFDIKIEQPILALVNDRPNLNESSIGALHIALCNALGKVLWHRDPRWCELLRRRLATDRTRAAAQRMKLVCSTKCKWYALVGQR